MVIVRTDNGPPAAGLDRLQRLANLVAFADREGPQQVLRITEKPCRDSKQRGALVQRPRLVALMLAPVVSPRQMDPAPFSAVLLAVLDARTPAWRVLTALLVLAGVLFLSLKS